MTTAFVSVIVADSTDMRVALSRTEEERRVDLLQFFNEVADEGDTLPDDAPLDEITDAIFAEIGRNVYLEENLLV